MMKLSECAGTRTLCQKCKELCRYQLRKKYDMSLWIYADDATDTPECTHRWTGDSRHHIWKILVVLGGVMLLGSALRWICHRLWS